MANSIKNKLDNLSPEKRALVEKLLAQKKQKQASSRGAVITANKTIRTQAPLSFAQQRLWLLDQLEGGSPHYNIPTALHIKGGLSVDALKQAFYDIVARHSVLRTVFVGQKETATQQVKPLPVDLCFEIKPISEQSDARYVVSDKQSIDQVIANLQPQVDQCAQYCFDLARDTLIRGHLWVINPEHSVLLIVVHHIAADGWSMGVLTEELNHCYQQHIGQLSQPLPPLALQYVDYATWQRDALSGEHLARQLDHWHDHLHGLPALHSLPLDRPRPAMPSYQGQHIQTCIGAAVTQAFKARCAENEATLFMGVYGVLSTLIARYSGESDIVIGTTAANRDQVEVAGLVGFFVNMLVLRQSISDDMSFADLLCESKRVALQAFAHQQTPFEHIVEKLNPSRDLSYHPLFQIMLAVQNNQQAELSMDGLTFSDVNVTANQAKFDLSLNVEEQQGELILDWEFSTDLFDATTIQRMADSFGYLIEAMAQSLDQAVYSTPMLSTEEQQRALASGNQTQQSYPSDKSVASLFEDQVVATPDAPAVTFGDRTLSYRELNQRANYLAAQLQQQGVAEDALVGVYLERSLSMLVALLAVLKSGGAYVPLDPTYPADRIEGMLRHSQPQVVVTTQQRRSDLPESTPCVLIADEVDNAVLAAGQENPKRRHASSHDLAYVIYTSGSTGEPKGIAVENRSVVNFLSSMAREPGIASHDRLLAVTSISFDIHVLELYLPLLSGAHLVLASSADSTNPAGLAELLDKHRITIMQATPSTWQMLLSEHWQADSELRMICGGEAMPNDLKTRLLSSDQHQLWNVYGPTETTVWSSAKALTHEGPITLGNPIANTQFYVLNAHGQLVPDGVPGELFIAGEGLARGYLYREDLTALAFVANPFAPGERMYRTGDRVRRVRNGELEYLGRLDHQVKIRGFRVELGAVDAALQTHSSVRQVLSLVRQSGEDAQLISYVIANESSEVSLPSNSALSATLYTHVKARLPHYMVPSFIVVMASFPLTPNGKIDRKALPQPDSEVSQSHYQAPKTPTEKTLTGLWSSVLNVAEASISRHAHFFEIGGQSLKAIQLLSLIRESLGAEVSMKDIFATPDLSALAGLVDDQLAQGRVTSDALDLPSQRVDRAKPLPLTHMQQRLWFIDQLEGGSCHYNMPLAFEWRGAISDRIMSKTLAALVNRHEILRTCYSMVEGGQAVQQVQSEVERFPIEVLDLSQQSESEQAHSLRQARDNQSEKPFDLGQDLMLRAQVITLTQTHHVMLLTLHHIAADGWSLDILMNEFSSLYCAFEQGKANPLAPLKRQYGDYADWQHHHRDAQLQQRHLKYWQDELEGLPVVHGLPLDYPRPKSQRYSGGVIESAIPSHQVRALKALCQRASVTPFMAVHALLATLIARFSGAHDIAIGTPVANRESPDVANTIGFFANTLVLRCDLSESPHFLALLAQCKDRALGAYEHQQVPFEQLVDLLQPERSLAHSPLFQIMLTLAEDRSRDGDNTLPFEAMDSDQNRRSAKFDLTLHVVDEGEVMTLGWEYASAIFTPASIEHLNQSFLQLLSQIVANPERSVMSLPLVTTEMEQRLVREFNQTQQVFSDTDCLHELIEKQVAKTPNAPAVHFEGTTLSYDGLNRRANVLARKLVESGVGRDSLVGLCSYRSLDMVVALLATLKAGAAYVPLDPDYPSARLEVMIADAAPQIVLTTTELAEQLPQQQGLLCLDTFDYAVNAVGQDNNLSVEGLNSRQLAYVIYTSGSTGQPKGVMNEHQAAVNRIEWMQQAFCLSHEDKVLQKTPFSFDVSVWEFFWPLMVGAQLVVAKPEGHKDVDYLLDTIELNGITTMHFVPPMLAVFIQDGRYQTRTSSLKHVFASGEALPANLVHQWTATHSAGLHNLYGPTEAAIDVSWHACLAHREYQSVPIGKPINNIQLYILNDERQIAPLGVAGELYIGGTGVARGYLNRPELTKERFIPDPFSDQPEHRLYKTGDLARWLENGEVEYLGRLDHQIKIRGFRVELGEIDAQLLAQKEIAESITIDVDGQTRLDRQLVSYLVLNEPVPETAVTGLKHKVMSSIGAVLPSHMLPSALVILEALPLTANGKVNRRALPAPMLSQRKEAYQAPSSEIEKALVPLWSNVLSLEEECIGRASNFFDIGGQSLKAIQLVSLIRQSFEVALTIKDLFNAPTLSALALSIEDAETTGDAVVKATQRSGLLPLSHTQQRLWFIDKMEGRSAHYNLSLTLSAKERIDLNAMTFALMAVVERHEILRTRFVQHEGKGWQTIDPMPATWDITATDVSGEDQATRRKRIAWVADQEANQPFDLENDKMMRAHVIHVSDQESLMVFTFHHIVVDGWSLDIFSQELTSAYQARLLGQPHALLPLEIQYGDYAIWQTQWLQGPFLTRKIAYWKRQLAGLPQVHSLPLDRPRPLVQSYRGGLVSAQLSEPASQGLKSLCREHNATLFMGLHAALSVLLSRWSGEEDIVIGTPVANRDQAEIANVIGFFANTLILRCDLSEAPSFKQLLEQCKTAALDAYQHQQVPFEQLVDVLQPERSLSHHPLFQVMLSMAGQTALAESDHTPQFSSVDLSNHQQRTAKFDLTLHAAEENGKVILGWEFCQDLFDTTTIERMSQAFVLLVEGMLEAPDKPVMSVPMLNQDQRQRLLIDYNQTEQECASPANFLSMFEAQARLTPDRPAVTCGEQSLSYSELNKKATMLAYGLRQHGVKDQCLVGIYLSRSVDMLVAMLAIGKSGGAYVPLDPNYPSERIGHVLEDAQPHLVLTRSALQDQLPDENKVRCLEALLASGPAQGVLEPRKEDELAYVIYTSGSTGKPKGIAIEHGALVNFLLSMQKQPGLQAQDALLAVTSMSFDIHTLELFLPLITGAHIVMADSDQVRDPYALARLLDQHKISAMQATPATWQMLLNIGWQPPLSLTMMCGGEAMSASLKQGLIVTDQHNLWDMYGPTETSVWSAVRKVMRTDEAAVIGGPIDNTQFYVLNAMMEPVAEGVPGELYIGGKGLARHYLNRPDLTEGAFVANPFGEPHTRLYKTGDQVRWLGPNALAYMGRLDNQVKIRGFRIELGDIETALLQDARVSEAVTCVRSHGVTHSPSLVSYVVLSCAGTKEDRAKVIAQMHQDLQSRLPAYMLPCAIEVLSDLPLTPNGKVDRKALPEPSWALTSEDFVEPESDTERQLAEIWQGLLGHRTSISREANFFDVGGQSLLIVSLVNQVEQLMKVKLAVKDVFAAPTLAQQAQRIEALAHSTFNSQERIGRVTFSEGAQRALYCFPGLGGMSIGFSALAQALTGEVNVIAYDAPGMWDSRDEADDFDAMVTGYVEDIQTDVVKGPLWLMGHSFGGRVAYEVARQLEALGWDVRLFLLDVILTNEALPADETPHTEQEMKSTFVAGLCDWLGIPVPEMPDSEAFDLAQATHDVTQKLQAMGLGSAQGLSLEQVWSVYQRQSSMNTGYCPRGKFNGPVSLLYCDELRPFLDRVHAQYQAWCSHTITAQSVSGEHNSMLKRPHVNDIASAVLKQINE
ncbi:non-ribosomal peptide synthetase [Vibrio ostreicida]|uniref:non-ribosomal peptide synthetase n=1 Tax=Vibrio ostreicida TaxID=526588 RepID=UPI000970CE14|nr:non-ribosomal peptide synthetase [Vibrio ostreicida]